MAYWLCCPAEIELRAITKSYDFFEENLIYKRVSAIAIRKWHYILPYF